MREQTFEQSTYAGAIRRLKVLRLYNVCNMHIIRAYCTYTYMHTVAFLRSTLDAKIKRSFVLQIRRRTFLRQAGQ